MRKRIPLRHSHRSLLLFGLATFIPLWGCQIHQKGNVLRARSIHRSLSRNTQPPIQITTERTTIRVATATPKRTLVPSQAKKQATAKSKKATSVKPKTQTQPSSKTTQTGRDSISRELARTIQQATQPGPIRVGSSPGRAESRPRQIAEYYYGAGKWRYDEKQRQASYMILRATDHAMRYNRRGKNCWDWVWRIYRAAGFGGKPGNGLADAHFLFVGSQYWYWRRHHKRPRRFMHSRYYDLLRPGDWLYYHNRNRFDVYGNHSSIFLHWVNRRKRTALVVGGAGAYKSGKMVITSFYRKRIVHVLRPNAQHLSPERIAAFKRRFDRKDPIEQMLASISPFPFGGYAPSLIQ